MKNVILDLFCLFFRNWNWQDGEYDEIFVRKSSSNHCFIFLARFRNSPRRKIEVERLVEMGAVSEGIISTRLVIHL